MISIEDEIAEKAQKDTKHFVDSDYYQELKAAILQATPSGESQGKTTALICHGRLLEARDIFDLLEDVARPKKKVPPPKRQKTDPDLDSD